MSTKVAVKSYGVDKVIIKSKKTLFIELVILKRSHLADLHNALVMNQYIIYFQIIVKNPVYFQIN